MLILVNTSCSPKIQNLSEPVELKSLGIKLDRDQIIADADNYLLEAPAPITNFICTRSAGTKHDYYSEGDYWWPDPKNPEGPYEQRDGQTNPNNFNDHRLAMRNLSKWVSTLVAAYLITGNQKYAHHAMLHLRTFFIDDETKMNPHLLFAQAIQGRVTGRGIGIIDTIHLIEVAKSIQHLFANGVLLDSDYTKLQSWFEDYATWMNTHPYGLTEKNHGNNHSTWWATQMAAFADLANRDDLLKVAVEHSQVLLYQQMATDGSFPEEIKRTKGYSYSLFNLEAYSILYHTAFQNGLNCWDYQSKNGSLLKAWEYMMPFIKDKNAWPKGPDVAHFDELPIQTVGLLMTAVAYQNKDFANTFMEMPSKKLSEEIERTFPLNQVILWFDKNPKK